MAPADPGAPSLRRTLGAWAITVFAIGDILGAGIYALIGKVAGEAGSAAWLSMLAAALIALFTGLSYAELASRFPSAGGAAVYCRRAFAWPVVGFLVGILVLASGVTSAATISRAFVGYLTPFVDIPDHAAAILLLALMSVLSWWGIRESSRVNVALTAVELSGLLLVIGAGVAFASDIPVGQAWSRVRPDAELTAILGGATVAFFAYVGFEDTVNLAEEVRDPARALPRAIVIAISVTTVIYLAVTAAALIAVDPERLARSQGPLLEVLDATGVHVPESAFSLVALLAVTNTGLLNLIMASRLLYGMAQEGLLPHLLARIGPWRHTPWIAVLAAFALATVLALTGGAKLLAQSTSLLLLMVFATVHVALLVIKRRPSEHAGFVTPTWAPVAGLLIAMGLMTQYPLDAFARAGIALAGGIGLYWFLARPVASPPSRPPSSP